MKTLHTKKIPLGIISENFSLHKILPENFEKENILLNSFYGKHNLDTKPNKDNKRMENYRQSHSWIWLEKPWVGSKMKSTHSTWSFPLNADMNLAACTEQKLSEDWTVNSGRQIKEDQNMKPWTGNEFIIFILWSSPTWSQMCTWQSGLSIALAFIFSGWRTKKSNPRELKSTREMMESEELGKVCLQIPGLSP